MRLLLAITVLVAGFQLFSGCGAGLMTAQRTGRLAPAHDVNYVRVLTGPPTRDYRIVSVAVRDYLPADRLAQAAPQDVIDAMRAEAAKVGADALVVERHASPWRKAFVGLGVMLTVEGQGDEVRKTAPCGADVTATAIGAVKSAAQECLARVQARRPSVRGEVEARFVVDPWGKVLSAVATPGSSRDGELQACVLEATYEGSFGHPAAFQCQASVSVSL